jgi:hypothetical protein
VTSRTPQRPSAIEVDVFIVITLSTIISAIIAAYAVALWFDAPSP